MKVSGASTLIGFAAACIASAPLAAAPARDAQVLETGWLFVQADAPDGQAEQADVSAWQPVTMPHSWNRVGYYLTGKGGTHTAETVDKYMGKGWYRTTFAAPGDMKGKRLWLEFDAASRSADIWVNGVKVGAHQGGFSRFRLDVTNAIRPGAQNLLAVRVDNTKPVEGSTTADVLPLTGDFFVHGGLYRPVKLITTSDLHVDMMDHGGSGIRSHTAKISADRAEVAAEVRVANSSAKPRNAVVIARLLDASGAEVGRSQSRVDVPQGATQSVSLMVPVARPRLWNGTIDPYLYRLVVDVQDQRGQTTDTVEQNIGIRQMAFDPDRGFLLNGKPYKLRGVGYHQDRDGKGWAITPADTEADVALLREMGANSIRLTHYQHGTPIHDIADRTGMILWDEIPLVSAWTVGESLEASEGLRANARQQLLEMIRQNQNHPSVAIWGIANEVDFGNSLPAFITGRKDGSYADPLPLLEELNALAKATDTSRPTALATCCEGRLFSADVSVPEVSNMADLGGANRYFGWYFGTADDLGPHLDSLRAKRPEQPLSVTEYGAGAAVSMHTDNVLGGPIDSRGRPQPEEYASYIHETALAQIESRPYLYASWLWNSFDFATTIRAEGDAQDINTKGLVTYDRSIKKDAFYLYKANWSDQPTVHITGRRHVQRAYPTTDIKVYSNAASTELMLNGVSLGAMTACPQNTCVWKDVRLAAGRNAISAQAAFDGKQVEDAVAWELPADALERLAIDTGTILAAQDYGSPIGSDHYFAGGTSRTIDKPADYGKPAQPTPISGSPARDALATYREGDFSYRIPMPKGRYKVRLWFTLPAGVNERQFDVLAAGKPVLRKITHGSAGEGAVAVSHETTMRSNGTIDLQFQSKQDKATVSLIEISKTP
nr:glycoside hydrolase family 2 TIM barrel-domain containing protein [Blastomonas sp. AAP53]